MLEVTLNIFACALTSVALKMQSLARLPGQVAYPCPDLGSPRLHRRAALRSWYRKRADGVLRPDAAIFEVIGKPWRRFVLNEGLRRLPLPDHRCSIHRLLTWQSRRDHQQVPSKKPRSDATSGKIRSGFGIDGSSATLRRLIQATVSASGFAPTMSVNCDCPACKISSLATPAFAIR